MQHHPWLTGPIPFSAAFARFRPILEKTTSTAHGINSFHAFSFPVPTLRLFLSLTSETGSLEKAAVFIIEYEILYKDIPVLIVKIKPPGTLGLPSAREGADS
ncbi:hypothetical protein K438DRAFT_1763640 [Mycena galopus ATCC 62051]|nr:hypothetical protein K438DRAFT_1763640 [Mycena galopus ATCC 62051]